jgi:glycosyltransferase involved in cell wall biosynthesis
VTIETGNTLVSIIVPAFNAGNHIAENLKSVSSQTYGNWECIIVNDGSTDNTREIIQEHIKNDSRFILINTTNSGVSSARNTAIRHSRGPYIFPLDSDNYLHEDCLRRCINEFQRDSDLKLVYTEAILIGVNNDLWNLPPFNYKTMLKYNMIDNSAMFLKIDFDRVGGYRTNMIHGLEDWDFFIALLYGYAENQIKKISDPLYYYRVSPGGRRLTVEKSGKQNEMLDLLIYNNFNIYRQYFPDIFLRIHEFDFDKIMLNKSPVKLLVKTLIKISTFKKTLKGIK